MVAGIAWETRPDGQGHRGEAKAAGYAWRIIRDAKDDLEYPSSLLGEAKRVSPRAGLGFISDTKQWCRLGGLPQVRCHENQLSGSDPMRRTRLSLFYLAGYLLPAGAGLLFAPQITLRLLLSGGDYGNIFPRLAGMFLLGLFIIVVQLIRLRGEVLYQTTIIVRAFFCVCLGSFYYISRDPLFLVMLGIVAFGVVLTASCYAVDRKRRDRASNRVAEGV